MILNTILEVGTHMEDGSKFGTQTFCMVLFPRNTHVEWHTYNYSWLINHAPLISLCVCNAGTRIQSMGWTHCQNKTHRKGNCQHHFHDWWKTSNVHMEHRGVEAKIPTTHAHKIEMRDAKMWRRESMRLGMQRNSRSQCPCSLCLFGRFMLWATLVKHLQDYEKHPMKWLQD